jgi:putative Holliday junction resolvase
MALDLGEARIGVAISDAMGISTRPLEPVRCVGSRKDLARVEALMREHEVETVVIGLPLTLSGEEGEAAAKSREFGDGLQKRLPRARIVFWDERLTTVEAERVLIQANVRRKRRRQVVDGLAAVLILQGFLDSGGVSVPPP